MIWNCGGPATWHHSLFPIHPRHVDAHSSHDTYRSFRSKTLDLQLEVSVAPDTRLVDRALDHVYGELSLIVFLFADTANTLERLLKGGGPSVRVLTFGQKRQVDKKEEKGLADHLHHVAVKGQFGAMQAQYAVSLDRGLGVMARCGGGSYSAAFSLEEKAGQVAGKEGKEKKEKREKVTVSEGKVTVSGEKVSLSDINSSYGPSKVSPSSSKVPSIITTVPSTIPSTTTTTTIPSTSTSTTTTSSSSHPSSHPSTTTTSPQKEWTINSASGSLPDLRIYILRDSTELLPDDESYWPPSDQPRRDPLEFIHCPHVTYARPSTNDNASSSSATFDLSLQNEQLRLARIRLGQIEAECEAVNSNYVMQEEISRVSSSEQIKSGAVEVMKRLKIDMERAAEKREVINRYVGSLERAGKSATMRRVERERQKYGHQFTVHNMKMLWSAETRYEGKGKEECWV